MKLKQMIEYIKLNEQEDKKNRYEVDLSSRINTNIQNLLNNLGMKINTDVKAGKKQKPRKSLNELEVKILFM